MKLLSTATLAAYGVLAASGRNHNHEEKSTGFVSVTRTQVHTRIARSEPLAEHLSSLKPEQIEAPFITATQTTPHNKRDIQGITTTLRFETPSFAIITATKHVVSAVMGPQDTRTIDVEHTKSTSHNKRDIVTSYVTPSPTTVTVSPIVDTTIIKTLPQTPVTVTASANPTKKADFYRQIEIEDACQPGHVKRCRLLAQSYWYPAGGKECWCIVEAKAPSEPAKPGWDDPSMQNLVVVKHIPPPAQAQFNAEGVMTRIPKEANWMQAVPTKEAGRDSE